MNEPQAINVIVAFVAGLIIIYLFARIIGEENKARWFKKRDQTNSFLNRRGFLGDTWHFGYPITWQGFAVMALMYGLILTIGYAIIFVF